MPNKLQIRRGTQEESAGITFAAGELGYLTDKQRLLVGDGVTPGGIHQPYRAPNYRERFGYARIGSATSGWKINVPTGPGGATGYLDLPIAAGLVAPHDTVIIETGWQFSSLDGSPTVEFWLAVAGKELNANDRLHQGTGTAAWVRAKTLVFMQPLVTPPIVWMEVPMRLTTSWGATSGTGPSLMNFDLLGGTTARVTYAVSHTGTEATLSLYVVGYVDRAAEL